MNELGTVRAEEGKSCMGLTCPWDYYSEDGKKDQRSREMAGYKASELAWSKYGKTEPSPGFKRKKYTEAEGEIRHCSTTHASLYSGVRRSSEAKDYVNSAEGVSRGL